MTQAAKYYIDMLKSIHAIEVGDNEVPDMKETALAWADFVPPICLRIRQRSCAR